MYDLKFSWSRIYDVGNLTYEPVRIVIDNEAAIVITKNDKDTGENWHVARRYYYAPQGTTMNKHAFEWSGTKYKLADTLTKATTSTTFGHIWSL